MAFCLQVYPPNAAGGIPTRDLKTDRDPRETIVELLASAEDGILVWHDEALGDQLSDPATWPALRHHGMEILHLGLTLAAPATLRVLQAIAGESPFVLPTRGARRRASWLLSPRAGTASLEALRLGGVVDRRYRRLGAWWAELGHHAQTEGAFPIDDRRLLRTADATDDAIRAIGDAPWPADDVKRFARRHGGRSGRLAVALERSLFAWRADPAAPPAPQRFTAAEREGSAETGNDRARDDVDVVIPTLERPELLGDVLDDLATQSAPPRAVMVVEQGPADEGGLSAALARRHDPYRLEHLRLAVAGASRARNAALRRTRASWVLLLDDDVRLPETLLADLVAEARVLGADALNAWADEPDPAPRPPAARPAAGVGSGRALVARRALLAVGGFDERLEGWGEDFELGLRLHLSGFIVAESSRSALRHLKAPGGGLRANDVRRVLEPWVDAYPAPKPSPLLLYRWRRWLTPAARRGIVLRYVLGQLGPPRHWPRTLPRLPGIWRRWRAAAVHAERLLQKGPKLLD